MPPTAAVLVAVAGAIFLALGALHVLITFRGPAMLPRDRALRARMDEVAPVVSRDTTMWRAWVGFNASHGVGAMTFGAAYAELALAHPALLAEDAVLQAVGAACIAAFVVLAARYWFRVPLAGVAAAALAYGAGLAGLHGAF
ncbi:MAG: LIC_13387 family protein [Burkholderiaceae bacterium]